MEVAALVANSDEKPGIFDPRAIPSGGAALSGAVLNLMDLLPTSV